MPTCAVCAKAFEQRFSFQAGLANGVTRHYCSQPCRMKAEAALKGEVVCHGCGKGFHPVYAYQQVQLGGERRNYCSMKCRGDAMETLRRERAPLRRIAVLNQKGGTGKTTTTVNLAAGLAARGLKTLLVDVDVQGNVAISLGIEAQGTGLAGLMASAGRAPEEFIVKARENLDLLAGGGALEQTELELARRDPAGAHRILRERLNALEGYAFVIVDCGPARSLLNQNALYYADQVIIPVGCDFLSLVGVRQILQTLRHINDSMAHPIAVLGVVPTFFDHRTRIGRDVIRNLKRYFGQKVMPPVRVNTRLKEAPAHNKTIFEHDSRSRGAEDYARLVDCVVTERWETESLDGLKGTGLTLDQVYNCPAGQG